MKKSLILTIASAIAFLTLGATAFAENTIDKGDLGKYVRQGRFVKPVLTAAPRDNSAAKYAEAQVLVDKGDLGTYVRQGRFLKPVLEAGTQNRTSVAAVPVSSVTHEHGLNGKEHKNIGHKRAN